MQSFEAFYTFFLSIYKDNQHSANENFTALIQELVQKFSELTSDEMLPEFRKSADNVSQSIIAHFEAGGFCVRAQIAVSRTKGASFEVLSPSYKDRIAEANIKRMCARIAHHGMFHQTHDDQGLWNFLGISKGTVKGTVTR